MQVTQKDSTAIPKNLLEEHITAHKQPTLGLVYDKKPFKVLLKPNKQYSWCCCGWSKNQVCLYKLSTSGGSRTVLSLGHYMIKEEDHQGFGGVYAPRGRGKIDKI